MHLRRSRFYSIFVLLHDRVLPHFAQSPVEGNANAKHEGQKQMKSLCLTLLALSASAFAQNNTVVRWRQIVGVITAPGVDSPVGGVPDASGNPTNPIHSGTLPWTTKGGRAFVNLTTGEGAFDVEGLVLNGGGATGTAGPITSVVGTLV